QQAKESRFLRLVCLFRLKDPSLNSELEKFRAENPSPQELAQANLLLAESYFQNAQWAEAANAYSKIRIRDLPSNLQADPAYKLAWCLARVSRHTEAVNAYSDFLEKFPKNELEDNALTGRGISLLQLGNHTAAIRDFDRVLQKSPPSSQRELALLNRGLAYGSLQQNDRMRADFEQLIREFPNSPARAQAEFWIGYSKFEAKDYRGSVPHFLKARELDPTNYGQRAGLRILLANYYLDDPEATMAELESGKLENIPPEIYQWLGFRFFERNKFDLSEKYLTKLIEDKKLSPPPSVYAQLARAQLRLGKFDAALASAQKYEEISTEPAERARAKLLQSEAAIGVRDYDRALALARDAQMLQPEGRINAEARMAVGNIQLQQGNPAEAAKTFLAIAVLYDDELLTPEALRNAAAAFRQAGDEAEAQKAEAELARRYPAQTQIPQQR
ncbi:MAG: tetratricopeptide repeat protein, partial [Chthoniobacterales bacterium]|nr:tetratricopeptide repeat protein [Chthoniobacterales bacterium]